MKVILLEDVKGTGKKGQVIDAADGHAKNYLMPRKLAVEATKANMTELEAKKKSEATKERRELEAAQELASRITDKIVKIPVKVGENGKLFGSVTTKEIASALAHQYSIEIDKKKIVLDEPIKAVGEKKVEVKLHPKVTARFTIDIQQG